MSDSFKHITVLLDEAVDRLLVEPDGFYVDGTFGRGGHSRLLLSKLGEQGHLLGIDKDPQAILEGEKLSDEDARFSIAHGSFAEMEAMLKGALHVRSGRWGVVRSWCLVTTA